MVLEEFSLNLSLFLSLSSSIYLSIYIFFLIIQRVKARAIPCPHQPPTRGDNTVSVTQGGTATPGAAFATGQGIKIIIYTHQIN